jgi:hypothetical protein
MTDKTSCDQFSLNLSATRPAAVMDSLRSSCRRGGDVYRVHDGLLSVGRVRCDCEKCVSEA